MNRKLKFLFIFLALIIGNTLFLPNFCVADPMPYVKGQMYFDQDLNYLIWSTGSHGGSAVDLSSAVIVKESDSMMLVAALNFSANYDKDTLKPDGTLYVYKNKEANSYYYKIVRDSDVSTNWFEFTNMNHTRNTFNLIISKAIDHRIASEK